MKNTAYAVLGVMMLVLLWPELQAYGQNTNEWPFDWPSDRTVTEENIRKWSTCNWEENKTPEHWIRQWDWTAKLAQQVVDLSSITEVPTNHYLKIVEYATRQAEVYNTWNLFYKHNGTWQEGLLYLSIAHNNPEAKALWRNFRNQYGPTDWLFVDTIRTTNVCELPPGTDLIQLWSKSANEGDPVSMFYMAAEHARRSNYTLAYRWMKDAAEAGLMRAQYTLEYWHYHSYETNSLEYIETRKYAPSDEIKQLYWGMRAAKQEPRGYVAQLTLEKIYYKALAISGWIESFDRNGIPHPPPLSMPEARGINEGMLIDGYVLSLFRYNNTTDESEAKSSKRHLEMFEKIMNAEQLQKAKDRAREYQPRLELNPDLPLLEGITDKIKAGNIQEQQENMAPAAQAERQSVTLPQSGNIQSSTEYVPLIFDDATTREQLRLAREQNLIQEQALAEQKRANEALEQQEKNRQMIEGMKTITEELHRQYPVYDPLAPGARNNPYTIEVK